MILDLSSFIRSEQPYWDELEERLSALDRGSGGMSVEDIRRLHYLYQRTSSDLAKLMTFADAPEIREYLESLVARAYGLVHENRRRLRVAGFGRALYGSFPRAFRRHVKAFRLSCAITLVGMLVGGLVLMAQPSAKRALLPFSHLQGSPTDRVVAEEESASAASRDGRAPFAAMLMTHNTRVSILCMALGMTWGIGTVAVLFHNGVILGAVSLDYVLAGEHVFLTGWLLPHGAIEIPAILVAGQAGLVLAGVLVGRGGRRRLGERLRRVRSDLVWLMAGVAAMLVWAGVVESFLSQYHEPVIPYAVKIAFGVLELLLLWAYLGHAGRQNQEEPRRA